MANKAVVGALALGVAGYTAIERLKDWEVEKEREEREQSIKDARAEYIRRLEESQRKRGRRSANKRDEGGIAADYLSDKLFQSRVYSHLEDVLYELAVRVGEEGGKLRNENLKQLYLPLMGNCNEVSVSLHMNISLVCCNKFILMINAWSFILV